MKLISGCGSCGKAVPLADRLKFIFTYRFRCDCGAKYKPGRVSIILATLFGVVFAKVAEFIFGIDWLVVLLGLIFVLGITSFYTMEMLRDQ